MSEQPPAAVTEDVDRSRAALDGVVPGRTGSNLLVATWNIRALGDLTPKWAAGPNDSPNGTGTDRLPGRGDLEV